MGEMTASWSVVARGEVTEDEGSASGGWRRGSKWHVLLGDVTAL